MANLGGRCAAVLGIVLAITTTSCAGRPASANSGIATDDQVAVYGAVIREVAGLEDAEGVPVSREGPVFLVRTTNDAAGNPMEGIRQGLPLSPEVQSGIIEALADLPRTIEWVDSFSDVEWTKGEGAVIEAGQIVELGGLIVIGDSEVHVPASSAYGSLGAHGTTYVVTKTGGKWEVTGRTGVDWVALVEHGLTSASS